MEDPELVVVGGGPVGSTVAAQTASFSTLVVEEHPEVGTPVQCTGLVHPRVVEMAGGESSVINAISGFKLFFPGGRVLDVMSNEVKAMVIDRTTFDRHCCDRAIDEGADVLTGRKFVGFRKEGAKARVRLEGPKGKEELTTSLIIGADGYKSTVGAAAGIGPAKETVRGMQVDLDTVLDIQSQVEVYLGKNVAPGFFAWVLPCGDFTRVGLCVSNGAGAPSKFLSELIRKRGLQGAERLRTYSGVIPIGPPKITHADNVLIVGDAAAQTKPLSGGGLFTGMRAAKWAAMTAVDALEEGDVSASYLSSYEQRWRSDIGKELERGMLVRKVYTKMSDQKLDEVGRMMDRDDAKEVLSTGDIDFPSKLARPMLKTVPTLIKFSPQALGSLLRKS
ncbi:geranylgeranyl reductase family protein [Methanomassiliicoccus luminyensis]|uniref:geranylgeranyl reductase family protein n=1 Tax=Methanomassiliicoccus luminyensis TaxID=1080712 RepID=UPI0003733902|nr:NAD(P)/FAD-dependent oxidoreductase [Methanomassiliicoccus luminyensis]